MRRPTASRRPLGSSVRADIVNLDVSAELDGYFSDTGLSTSVGEVSALAAGLLEATRLAQLDAMRAARAGNKLNEIGRAVRSGPASTGSA